MRCAGPGEYRLWRWGNLTVPLYMPEPPKKPAAGEKKPPEEGEEKSINEVAYLTIRALSAKNSLPKLVDNITDMLKEPDSPGGRIQEKRFREVLKVTSISVLTPEECELIFPMPAAPMVRRGSKIMRRASKTKIQRPSMGSIEE